MQPYEDCILFFLSKAYQKAYSNFKKRLHPYGLTPVQSLVLMVLFGEEGLSAGELGGRLRLDNATLSGVLDRLADSGWIVKGIADKDKRLLQIQLTDRAREIRETLMAEKVAANEEIMKDLRLEERLLLKRMLLDLKA